MLRGRAVLFVLLATPIVAADPLTKAEPRVGYEATQERLRTDNNQGTRATPESFYQITTLLKKTGITAYLPDIYAVVEQSRDRHILRCGIGPDSSRRVNSYKPVNLYAQLHRSLRKNLQADHLKVVLNWYDSNVGKLVVDSEKRPRPEESFESVLTLAMQAPDWNKRLLLLKQIERHTNANRLNAITGTESEYGGLVLSGCIESHDRKHSLMTDQPKSSGNNPPNRDGGLNTPAATDDSTNPESVMAQTIRNDKPFYEKLFYKDTMESMIFSLQDLKLTDLTQYAEFTASAAAHHVYKTLVDSIDHTLQAASTISVVAPMNHEPQPALSTQLE